MAYDSKAVANFFLDVASQEGKPLSPMKLLKLLFFAHGWYLSFRDQPLLKERVEAWGYGPVVPSVYHEFKRFGNDPITSPASDLVAIDGGGALDYEVVKLPEDQDAVFVRKLLRRVWDVYGPFTAVQLSNMTHQKDTPWSKAVEPFDGAPPRSLVIDDDVIKGYFDSIRRP